MGCSLPEVELSATDGAVVTLANLAGVSVVYVYPLTGTPGADLPEGWDAIPGARGCTAQACSFRDHHAELSAVGARVFGLSAQDTEYQREAAQRLHLPFPLLSDAGGSFAGALRLPTFRAGGMTLLKRVTLVCVDAVITTVFYPVFPPDRNADEVLAYLQGQAR